MTERDPAAVSLIAALRRASLRVVEGSGMGTRSPERDRFDPDELRKALYVVDHAGDFDAETCLAAWAVLKAFRGEFTDIERVRRLAGLHAAPELPRERPPSEW